MLEDGACDVPRSVGDEGDLGDQPGAPHRQRAVAHEHGGQQSQHGEVLPGVQRENGRQADDAGGAQRARQGPRESVPRTEVGGTLLVTATRAAVVMAAAAYHTPRQPTSGITAGTRNVPTLNPIGM